MLPPICSMLASKMVKMVSTKYASQHTQSTLGMLNCIKGMLISTPVTPVSIQGMLDRIQSMLVSTVRTLSMLVSIPHMLNYTTLINVVSTASMLITIRVCKELLPCLLCVRKIRTVFLLTSIHSMLTSILVFDSAQNEVLSRALVPSCMSCKASKREDLLPHLVFNENKNCVYAN